MSRVNMTDEDRALCKCRYAAVRAGQPDKPVISTSASTPRTERQRTDWVSRDMGKDSSKTGPAYSELLPSFGNPRTIWRTAGENQYLQHLEADKRIAEAWVTNTRLRPSAIDLVFATPALISHAQFNVVARPDQRIHSDHAPIFISLPIEAEPILNPSIPKGSEAESDFTQAILTAVSSQWQWVYASPDNIETSCITIQTDISVAFARLVTAPSLTKRSCPWWMPECQQSFQRFRRTRNQDDRCEFLLSCKRAKRAFFDRRIDHICDKGWVWDLTSWIKPRRPESNATLVSVDGLPIIKHAEVNEAMRTQFFSAADCPIDFTLFTDFPALPPRGCPPISLRECHDAVAVAKNSAPGGDRVTWHHIKALFTDHQASLAVTKLFNACLRLGHWPSSFKHAITVVIPKPNKADYGTLKSYCPIILLSCLGKLFECIIATHFQFQATKFQALHPSQCGGTIQHCTEDAGVLLIHHIKHQRKKGRETSALAFDIAQCFPSINHAYLKRCLAHFGFAPEYCAFIRHYLSGRTTSFRWHQRLLDPVDCSVGVGQGSALSPILANLAIAPILHVFSHLYLPLTTSTFSSSITVFVDDGCLLQSSPSIDLNCDILGDLSSDLTRTFWRAGFVLEPDKFEIQHFPLPSNTTPIESQPPVIISPHRLSVSPSIAVHTKPIWRILGFWIDQQLKFNDHIKFYVNKALSTLRAYPMLGNSIRGIAPLQKCRLYVSCVRPILTYGFRLWYTPKVPKRLTEPLCKAQSLAA